METAAFFVDDYVPYCTEIEPCVVASEALESDEGRTE